MDFDQLHTFLEIVRLKSFSKAAQTCYRTQPAISAQVRQLEQELRADLFERFGSKISLTTAGRIFAQYSEQILDLRRRVQDEAVNAGPASGLGDARLSETDAPIGKLEPPIYSAGLRVSRYAEMDIHCSCGRFESGTPALGRLECVSPLRQVAGVARNSNTLPREAEISTPWTSNMRIVVSSRGVSALSCPLDDCAVGIVTAGIDSEIGVRLDGLRHRVLHHVRNVRSRCGIREEDFLQ